MHWLPGLRSCHVLVLGTVTGMVLHTTFVTGIIQFKNLPKHVFGNLQSKQFPVYFAIQSIGGLLLAYTTSYIAGYQSANDLLSAFGAGKCPVKAFTVWTTVAGTFGAFINWWIVGPQSTKVMFERHKLEKEGTVVPKHLNSKFGILHGVSSLLNLVMVVAVITNCLWTGGKIK